LTPEKAASKTPPAIRRRTPILTTLVVALAGFAAGCGGEEKTGNDGEVSGTVRLFAFGDPEELQAFKNVIAAFEQEEPDVDVQLVETSDRDDLIARVSTSIAGGKPPELFLINYRFFGQFAARDVLEPLEERLESSDVFEEGDFYAGPLDAFRFGEDRTITCLPQNASSLVTYYNRDLFEAAGVPEPEDDWTWKDFTDRAVALTEDTNGDGTTDVHGAGIEASLIRLAPFLWSNGAELVKDDLSGFDLGTPEAAEVLDQFFSLHVNYRAIPGEEEEESEDSEARFMNGRMAMYFDSRRATPGFRTITGFDWDVAPLPRFDEPSSILHSDAYCMPRGAENKDAAWRFVEFALGPDGQRITAEAGRTVPSLKSVAGTEAFLDPDAKPARSQVFLDNLDHVRAVPSISTWPEIEDVAGVFLEEAMYEEGELPSEVARQLDAKAQGPFARAER
jgi:multiple sugar transport system substrate-binding protein